MKYKHICWQSNWHMVRHGWSQDNVRLLFRVCCTKVSHENFPITISKEPWVIFDHDQKYGFWNKPTKNRTSQREQDTTFSYPLFIHCDQSCIKYKCFHVNLINYRAYVQFYFLNDGFINIWLIARSIACFTSRTDFDEWWMTKYHREWRKQFLFVFIKKWKTNYDEKKKEPRKLVSTILIATDLF